LILPRRFHAYLQVFCDIRIGVPACRPGILM
jgi:hypothetical protein